jgi:hypothetical protein
MAVGTRRMRITTIETDKVTIIRRHVGHTWCRECCCEVEVVGIEGARVLAGLIPLALRNCGQSQVWVTQGATIGSARD